ncbi:MAG: hypothetical protein LW750_02625 [Bacteroidetes bacterium]|jgi:hypothetical protein|nr:hypothetical protein [Bacteroidota bacterium]
MPIIFFAFPFLFVPFITAYFARSSGRHYKTWLLIGCLLPIVSVIILFFLPEKKVEESTAD